MKMKYITKEEAESFALRLPSISSHLLTSSPECKFILITEDSFPLNTYDIAIVEDDEISFITDEKLRKMVESNLNSVLF